MYYIEYTHTLSQAFAYSEQIGIIIRTYNITENISQWRCPCIAYLRIKQYFCVQCTLICVKNYPINNHSVTARTVWTKVRSIFGSPRRKCRMITCHVARPERLVWAMGKEVGPFVWIAQYISFTSVLKHKMNAQPRTEFLQLVDDKNV